MRGGGGGGTRLWPTFVNNSAFRSGTGGLPTFDRVFCCGGLVSVSDPLGYECNRLKLDVLLIGIFNSLAE